MRRRIWLGLMVLRLIFAVAPDNGVQAQTSPPPLPKAQQRLTGFEAFVSLIGNTLVGTVENKGETALFFAKDGTVKFQQDGHAETGSWTFDGKLLCTIESNGHKDCFSLEINGDEVRISSPDHPGIFTFTLVQGNPKNL